MIGIFDSGLGGLIILRALHARFPEFSFRYLGDHANVPYGERSSEDVIALTTAGVETLFCQGARLVLLGCNTATAVAARTLQQEWLPHSDWADRNVLGIVAPTVEAATQTPWAVTTPQYPQKFNSDVIAVFGTTRTISAGVYAEEIKKRCPLARVIEQACPGLAGAVEAGDSDHHIERHIKTAINAVVDANDGNSPDRVILGCTHYPLVEDVFRRQLPSSTRLLSQPEIVANSLEDYLARHQKYVVDDSGQEIILSTTGNVERARERARVFWPESPEFQPA